MFNCSDGELPSTNLLLFSTDYVLFSTYILIRNFLETCICG